LDFYAFVEAKPVCPGTTLVHLPGIIGEMWTFDNTFFRQALYHAFATTSSIGWCVVVGREMLASDFKAIASTKPKSHQIFRNFCVASLGLSGLNLFMCLSWNSCCLLRRKVSFSAGLQTWT
jgi:hypothetical protein